MVRNLFLSTNAIWFAAFLAGCGSPKPEFASVTGTLLLNGKPQRGLRVSFMPDAEKNNTWAAIARGTTDEQGKYTLTYEYQREEGTGAPVGWHRVLIEDVSRPPTPQGQTPPPPLVPPEYSSDRTTPLRKEVKPGEQTIDLDVKK